jgi:hypothetical protein
MTNTNWTIIDVASTPSGYYEIAFRERSTNRTIRSTQLGRGGCNMYAPHLGRHPEWDDTTESFYEWLGSYEDMVIDYLNRIGFPELGRSVQTRDLEWYDTVVMSMVDFVELGIMEVEG